MFPLYLICALQQADGYPIAKEIVDVINQAGHVGCMLQGFAGSARPPESNAQPISWIMAMREKEDQT